MLHFGVPRLDDVFAQEAPRQPLLLLNEPGVDAMPFVIQAARCMLEDGGDVVFLNIDRPSRRVVAAIEPSDEQRSRLHILDGYSSLHGIADEEATPVDAADLAALVGHLAEAVRKHPEALVVVDSLNGMVMRQDAAHLAAGARRLVQALEAFPMAIVTYTQWQEEPVMRPLLDRFPHRIHLQAVEQRIVSHQYFRVEQVGGRPFDDGSRVLYRADEHGVRVYVPKVVVTGPADAGKTTFVHAISDRARSVERRGSTVAMDRGIIDHDGMRVELFGTPGQERFDPLHSALIGQAVGIVLIVDATAPETFPRALEMLMRAWRHGLAAIVVANKQDLAAALSPDEVASLLGAPSGIDVLACHATEPQEAIGVMDQLLDRILEPQEVAA